MSNSVRRPSPALMVAIVALIAALAGSAIALPGKNSVKKNDIAKNAVVSKAIKNNKVKSKDVKNESLAGVDVRNESLSGAEVTNDSLDSADVKNGSLLADDVKKGELTSWVWVDEDGSIIDQSGGITVDDTGAGSYLVRFPRSVKGHAISVTPTVTAADVNPTGGGLVRVAPCVTPSPPAFSCAPAANDNQNVGVFTKNESGAAADRSYLLTVFYP